MLSMEHSFYVEPSGWLMLSLQIQYKSLELFGTTHGLINIFGIFSRALK